MIRIYKELSNFRIDRKVKSSIIYLLNTKDYCEDMTPEEGEWISLKGKLHIVRKVNFFKPKFEMFNNFVSVILEEEI